MTDTLTLQYKQAIVNEFNAALALLNTSREELQLNAMVSNTFRQSKSLVCEVSTNIALLHQYALIESGYSASEYIQKPLDMINATNISSDTLLVHDGKQCLGGARASCISREQFASTFAGLKLRNYGVGAEMVINENVLFVQGVSVAQARTVEVLKLLWCTLFEKASNQGIRSVCVLGATADLRAMQCAVENENLATQALSDLFHLSDAFDDYSLLHIRLNLH